MQHDKGLSIRLLCLALAAGLSVAAPGAAMDGNLLRGDPSFETGMSTWQALSTFKKADYLNNQNAKRRIDGLPRAEVRLGAGSEGKGYLHVRGAQGLENVVTAPSIPLKAGSRYTFAVDARCGRTTDMALSLVRPGKMMEKTHEVNTAPKSLSGWTRLVRTISISIDGAYVPQLSWWGEADCDLDAFSLRVGDDATYLPAPAMSASLALAEEVPGPMPNLLVNDTPGIGKLAVKTQLSLFSTVVDRSVAVQLSAKSAEGETVDAQEMTVSVPHDTRVDTAVLLQLPAVGSWLVTAEVKDAGGQDLVTTQMAVARIDRYQGVLDPYFGVHQKWTPLVGVLGFGSIRDMHLFDWGSVMPTPESWVAPAKEDLLMIKEFCARGGRYLVTLVAENPMKKPWNQMHWGKDSYGPLPLWSGNQGRNTQGMFGAESVDLNAKALAQYVERVAGVALNDEFEFMNEPAFFMPPATYAELLKIAVGSIRKAKPQATIVAFANPPYYPKLLGGREAKRGDVDPWYWFDQVVEATKLEGVDVVGVHTYGRYNRQETPETGYGGMGEAVWASTLKKRVEERIGRPIQLWVTEKGIASIPWKSDLFVDGEQTENKVRSPLTQARWLVRAQIDTRSRGGGRFYVFNRPWDENWNDRYAPSGDQSYTMFEADGQPRPILVAQSVLIQQLANWQPLGGGVLGKSIYYAAFEHGGRARVAFWMSGKDEAEELASKGSDLTCPSWLAAGRAVTMFGEHLVAPCPDGTLRVRPSPIFVELEEVPSLAALSNLKELSSMNP